ncbi:MAG: proline racemase family protein [Vicinamibacterales bacterium]
MIHRIKTIDAHAAGEPLRLVVEGFPRVEGATMLEKREWVREHHDRLRRALMLEPRGHADMYGALLTEPERLESDAGVLFMHNEGYSTMCGHGVIAVVTIALERALLMPRPGQQEIVLDSPAGAVRARATMKDGKIDTVAFSNVPSFVLAAGVPIQLGGRELRVDVAFGGAFYAIADVEAAGLAIDPRRLPELRRVGMAIRDAVETAVKVEHPLEPGLRGLYGTIFTGPSTGGADLRNVTVFADAEVDRSPCGTGTSAVMAVLAAMGLLAPGATFTHESIVSTIFRGRILQDTLVGDLPAIVPEIEGSAWITGEHTFLVDDRDPLRAGFRLY